MTVRAVFEVTRLNTHDMAKKIQAYIDAPVIDPPDQHTKLIASVVAAPLADADPVRCVTLIDHEGNKHERTFTESEVRAILSAAENVRLRFNDLVHLLPDGIPARNMRRAVSALLVRSELLAAEHGLSDPA